MPQAGHHQAGKFLFRRIGEWHAQFGVGFSLHLGEECLLVPRPHPQLKGEVCWGVEQEKKHGDKREHYTVCKTRSRSKSNWARPYICRLCTFKRFTCPSTWPLLHAEEKAARTAA